MDPPLISLRSHHDHHFNVSPVGTAASVIYFPLITLICTCRIWIRSVEISVRFITSYPATSLIICLSAISL